MAFKMTWKSLRLSCFKAQSRRRQPLDSKDHVSIPGSARRLLLPDISETASKISLEDLSNSLVGSNVHVFPFADLKLITNDFSSGNFLGEGGFGPVYKGFVDDRILPGLQAQPVAVKLLDLDGGQGHKEWLTEVIFLGQLRHPHLVKLIGYCCEDKHRLLVYEYMERGNLENQLFRRYSTALPWLTRIKIAVGAAKGLAFLHDEEKPIIYRDFKASNVLLDSDYTAKLSDFGFAKEGPEGDETHVTTRVMGTRGYAAPEYVMTGHLTTMSDVYSFGVVLLELITGRKALDKNRPSREQNLVDWAKPMLKDPHRLERIMDTRLEGQYSMQGAIKVAALAYRCVRQNPRSRPTMEHVVKVLGPILDLTDFPARPFVYIVPTDGKNNGVSEATTDEKGPEEDEEEEEDENQMNEFEGGAAEVGVTKGNGDARHRRPRKHRLRTRSRTVFSDTALYKMKKQELKLSSEQR